MTMCFFAAAGCGRDNPSLEELQARLQKLESTAPGVGSAMTAAQIHFGKLYYAGQARNWGLAEYELHEVEENLEIAVNLRPQEQGVDLAGLTGDFMQTQLAALRQAIEKQDGNAFLATYKEAMSVCNACHAEIKRQFLVITLPKAPPVTNQQWELPDPLTHAGSVQ
jgi:hypothetical protein